MARATGAERWRTLVRDDPSSGPQSRSLAFSGLQRGLAVGQRGAPAPNGESTVAASPCLQRSRRRPLIESLARSRILGKSPLGAYLRLNESIWIRLPRLLTASRTAAAYCRILHALARRGERRMRLGTFFLRNRPQLELICRLAGRRATARALRVAVLGCSVGAEVYSIRWSLASVYPDLKVELCAVDISQEIIEFARRGVYSLGVSEEVDTPILERLTEDEIQSLFDREAGQLRIKSWLREGLRWAVGDAGDPHLVDVLGRQDLVIANDFLCHMEPAQAEACLRNLVGLVDPGGHLVVSGVDLDVRTRVATDLGWKPVRDSIEDVHEGDPVLRSGWPWGYWGLEPLDKSRADWNLRYASIFEVGAG